MELELPFKAEYAKSGRAGCKGCKGNIGLGSLRIAAMVQSAFHDSKTPNWFHEACFFKKQRPGSAGDVANFENLRFEDQERVKKKIDELSLAVVVSMLSSGKGKKRTKTTTGALKDFGIEYAKSGRSTCRGCEQKILKDQIRIRKTVYDTDIGMKYGGQPLWHHIECFVQVRGELGWLVAGELLPGFESLKSGDQSEVKKTLPAMKGEDLPEPAKKVKLENLDEQEEKSEEQLQKTVKMQAGRLFKFRDRIKNMKKSDIIHLLKENSQEPVNGESEKLLDQAADLITFGAIAACPECKGTQMLFSKSGYLCNGQLTEWTKCNKLIKEPERIPCKIPAILKNKYDFFGDVSKKAENRAIRYIPPSASTIAKSVPMKTDEIDGPKVKRDRPALYNLTFAHLGLNGLEEELKKRVMKLGGKLDTKINEKVIAIFSTAAEVRKMGSRMRKAKDLGIHVIPIEYLDSVDTNPANSVNYISSMCLCDWGTDPAARVPQEETNRSKSKSIYTKSVPKSMTLKVKGGLAVDPDSGLEDVAHIYMNNKDKYNVVLGLTDIQHNRNSYYKLQLLQSDAGNRYWIFRSWGRIGTTIGGNKLESCSTLFEAKELFEELYFDKSGNKFQERHNFEKVLGRMYPIDIEYAEDPKDDLDTQSKIKSELHPAVQHIIKLIFDVDTMKRTMMEFDLDMEKMPLGKLSQKQIQSAYKVLNEIYALTQNPGKSSKFIDATNRFYTLIPHNFGVEAPPLLNTIEQIEKLRDMLDSLMEIECAYNLLKTENNSEDVNTLDKHYEQLKTKLEYVDKKSGEFSLLEKYVANTHAKTHSMYDLEIMDVFKVARNGETRRFKPFKKLHNRKLLWHGSRLTNFAGILSHGLKIAPPEAPVTGYMFGKGIYFADMVSKSANYCCTSKENSTGLMLLSEVALGDMLECTSANYVKQLPKDKHSCYGRGSTMPNPKESVISEDGVEIPLGKPTTDDKIRSNLLYNEYIVYDIAQIKIQYLLRMNFKYKY